MNFEKLSIESEKTTKLSLLNRYPITELYEILKFTKEYFTTDDRTNIKNDSELEMRTIYRGKNSKTMKINIAPQFAYRFNSFYHVNFLEQPAKKEESSEQMIFRAMAPIALMLFILTASYAQNDERTMTYNSNAIIIINAIKRNNAEMINHILKHYGTLSQLGNVGSKEDGGRQESRTILQSQLDGRTFKNN
ncbi:hypothetical protein DICVIV_07284 [Dictyocaulus viviparus]|uniref:Uncharacterized protein n=1 Tax=Dictyocaulus viviparus TaxID=29172 RepID=A0A0D8XQ03_DICVI|nr:hypothetical protein DICVIV_07284 [Dictyocaulus viviparus]